MWYDSTALASNLEDRRNSKVAGKLGYAPTHPGGEHGQRRMAAGLVAGDPGHGETSRYRMQFISWATSRG